jgi:hypothetical protein
MLPGKEAKPKTEAAKQVESPKPTEAKEVPETTQETPQDVPSEEPVDEESSEVTLEQVAMNHEQRIANLEAAFFRLRNSL